MSKDTEVHLRHSVDGYPLCWPMTQDGPFEGSFKDEDVTCKKCIQLLKEMG